MNVDYVLPATPANARKLAYLKEITNSNVDETLLAQVGDGLLTIDEVLEQLPYDLRKFLNPQILDVIQHTKDHDYRCGIATRSWAQSASYSLMAAFNSGLPILLVPGKDQKNGNLWSGFLKSHGLDHQHVRVADDVVDHTQKILVLEQRALTEANMNQIRKRILVFVDSDTSSSSLYDLDSLFQSVSLGSSTAELFREFPHVIGSFYMKAGMLEWWRTPTARDIIVALHPGLNVDRVLAVSHHEKNALLQAGFILNSPRHMARLLGVHMGILCDGLQTDA